MAHSEPAPEPEGKMSFEQALQQALAEECGASEREELSCKAKLVLSDWRDIAFFQQSESEFRKTFTDILPLALAGRLLVNLKRKQEENETHTHAHTHTDTHQEALGDVLSDPEAKGDAPPSPPSPPTPSPPASAAGGGSGVTHAPAVVQREPVDESTDLAPTEPRHTQLTNEPNEQVTVQRQQDAQHLVAVKSWDELALPADLLKGIHAKGFIRPSKIQEVALPLIIKHHGNLIAQAQIGSGVSATIALGMLAKIDVNDKTPQALCLSPTRELAIQNLAVIKELGKYTSISMGLIVPQMDLEKAVMNSQILVGTPGKVADLVKRGAIKAQTIKLFVLDEADVMVDPKQNMGPYVAAIRGACGKVGGLQILLFGYSLPDDVRQFAMNMAPHANNIIVRREDRTANIQQKFIPIEKKEKKFQILCDLYNSMIVGQSVIFVNSRHEAFSLAKKLGNDGHTVSLICGFGVQQNAPAGAEVMDPKERDKVLQEFRNGATKVLVATDVLARGIDMPAVRLVINYDLPLERGVTNEVDLNTYLHRICRTGRFGARGISINLVTPEELHLIDDIKAYYRCEIDEIEADGEKIEEMVKALR